MHGKRGCCKCLGRAFCVLFRRYATPACQCVCLGTCPVLPLRLIPPIVSFVCISASMGCLPPSLYKGRTETSAVGLFPQSFTTPDPPEAAPTTPQIEVHEAEAEVHSPTVLQTLREEPESGLIGPPNPDLPATDGEVMHATMTDVQKAIEQLGRHDADGARSFSFASSRGEGDGDWTDRDSINYTDGEVDGWHLNARQRLAEKSRMVNEESAGPSTPMRISAPPIEVELSDESDTEDNEHTSRLFVESPFLRHHPHIPEEEEDAQPLIKAKPSNIPPDLEPGTPVVASDAYILPSPGVNVDDLPTATLPGKSFVKEQEQDPREASPEPDLKPAPESEPEVKPDPQPELVSPADTPLPTSPSPANGISHSPPPSTPPPLASPVRVPSIALTNGSSERTRTPVFQPPSTASSSTITSIGIQQAFNTPTKPQSPFWSQETKILPLEKPASSSLSPTKLPTEWTVDEVVDWLKSKGIDQGTCDRFIGIYILLVVRVHSADVPLRRTRYYWGRSSRVGPRVAQERDRSRGFRQTQAYC